MAVDEYIKAFPASVQTILKGMRRAIKKAAPRAVELIRYQMPAYKLDGQFLVSFAAWKDHIGLYPVPAGTAAFQRKVLPYQGAKSTLRLPIKAPIPYDLVAELVGFRIKENRAK
jgi:uncharacterized protein YdhG (YjbR/CyaY superfamily)